ELTHLRPSEDPLLHQHFDTCAQREIPKLVVCSFGHHEVQLAQRVQQWERVRDHGRVVILTEEDPRQAEQVVKRRKELRSYIGRMHFRYRLADELQAEAVGVLIRAT